MGYKAALGMSIALLLSVQASTAFAFGAFAVNDSKGTSASDVGYGTGWGSTSKEAERDAMKSCRDAGNECLVFHVGKSLLWEAYLTNNIIRMKRIYLVKLMRFSATPAGLRSTNV